MDCPHSHLTQVVNDLFQCIDCGMGIEILQAREVSSQYSLAALMISLPHDDPQLFARLSAVLDDYYGESVSDEEDQDVEGDDEAEDEEVEDEVEEAEEEVEQASPTPAPTGGPSIGQILESHNIDPRQLTAEEFRDALVGIGMSPEMVRLLLAAKMANDQKRVETPAPVATAPAPAPEPTATAPVPAANVLNAAVPVRTTTKKKKSSTGRSRKSGKKKSKRR